MNLEGLQARCARLIRSWPILSRLEEASKLEAVGKKKRKSPPPAAGPSSRSSASDNLNATHICNTLSCDVNVVRSFPAPVWADDEAAWLGPVPGGAADGLDMRLVSNE
jgi:hypothetical protein